MSVVSPSLRSKVRASIEGPVAAVFIRLRLTPNMLTLIGFGISVIGAVLAAANGWLLAAFVVAFGAIFDLFDGALARATGKTSRLGAFLDSTFDRAGEAVVYLGVAYAYLRYGIEFGGFLAAIAMAAAFMVSYTRAKSESLGFTPGTGMANIGLAPREVRTVILVIGLLAAGLLGGFTQVQCIAAPCPPIVDTGGMILTIALGLIALLATVTVIQRIFHVYQQAKKEP
jgi:CDP-diacylglycerol--glycerol-3-phosphate 3-phosphatidyltransferase